jgi:hypothetical protein
MPTKVSAGQSLGAMGRYGLGVGTVAYLPLSASYPRTTPWSAFVIGA